MKRWIVLCLLMVPFLASADSYWEGAAALQRGDAAFESGLYAASNSFAPDTQLSVQNLDSGKSAVVTVSERIDGQSDILVLLSPRAADAIGIAAGSIARVRVTVVPKAISDAGSNAAEKTFNPDTDANPAAAYQGSPAQESPAAAQPAQPVAAAGTAAAGSAAAGAADTGAAAAETAPGTAASGAAAAATAAPAGQSAQSEDAEILSEAESRSPQKQLFLPPREDPKFAYKPSAEAPAAPTVEGETTAPSQQQSSLPLAEAQATPQAGPQETGQSVQPQPAPAQGSAQLALPEASPQGTAQAAAQSPSSPAGGQQVALQPPEAPPAQAAPSQPAPVTPPQAAPKPVQPPAASTSASGQVQLVSTLPRLKAPKGATFYVQLAAYGAQQTAQDVAGRLVQTYPVVVLAPATGGKQIYRVLVGPLNKAESGTLLPVFKFRGFRDAFVRRE